MRMTAPRALLVSALFLLLGCGSNSNPGTVGDPGKGGSSSGGRSGSGGKGGSASSGGAAGSSASGGAGGATSGGGGTASGGTTGGSAGAGGTSMGGSGGAGPATDAGGSDTGPSASCGWTPGYKGPLLGRCNAATPGCVAGQCGISVGKGGFLTLDDFEITPTSTVPIGIHFASRDGRTGSWTQFASPAGKVEVTATDTAGGSANSKQALHYSGGPGTFEATLALPMGTNCYDASAYQGISFWIKGNPGAGNAKIKFNVHTPVSEPATSGGACTDGCYDHFGKVVDVTGTWTRYKVKWTDLQRSSCTKTTPPIPDGFEPHKQIVSFSFSVMDKAKGFDFWLDDMTFDVADSEPNTFGDIFTKPMFDEMFKTPAAPYSYDGLVSAVGKYGGKFGNGTFAGDGTPLDRKHEIAAFLAQITHETGSLTLAEEMCKCTMPPYYGRGAIQLTGQFNYQSAQDAGFPGIVADPSKVISTADFAFGTALWFWMTPRSAVGVCHTAIVGGNFGQTTRIINGIECGSDPASKQHSRAQLYKDFLGALGANPRGSLLCQ
jgi:hypothetical protein